MILKKHFPLSTKLIFTVSLLIIFVITLLSLSTIYIFNDDKKAYIYETQATESALIANQFALITQTIINTLKAGLSSLEATKKIDPIHEANLKSLLLNQNLLQSFFVFLYQPSKKTFTSYVQISKDPKHLFDIEITKTWIAYLFPALHDNLFTFLNNSDQQLKPSTKVFYMDPKLKLTTNEYPIIVGDVFLENMIQNSHNHNITIATLDGRILYDTFYGNIYGYKNIYEDLLYQTALNSKLPNGTLEYTNNNQKILGSYVIHPLGFTVLNRIEWKKANQASLLMIERCLLLGIGLIAFSIIASIFFSKTISAPIEKLYEATKKIMQGDFDIHLDIKTYDEVGSLTSSFNLMSQKISELIKESISKTKIENEINIVSTVQKTLIPHFEFSSQEFSLFSHYQTASQCGGDWWGYFQQDQKIIFMIADATGHGLPSALITAAARSFFSMIQSLAQTDERYLLPSNILSYGNKVIFDCSLGAILMSAFVCCIDLKKQELLFSNAAHNHPFLIRNTQENVLIEPLIATGELLGSGDHLVTFENHCIKIQPQDILFFYTDGLTECGQSQGEMFGKKRVRDVLKNPSQNPKEIIQKIMHTVNIFMQNHEFEDDLTTVALKIEESFGV